MLKQADWIDGLNELKKDAQEMQRKGLPFMMASVMIWSVILGLQSMNLEVLLQR